MVADRQVRATIIIVFYKQMWHYIVPKNAHQYTNARVIYANSAVLYVYQVFEFFLNMESLSDASTRSKRQRVGVRQSLQLTHADDEAKKSFSERLENLRQALTPGSKDNLGLITKLMDIAEAHCRGHPQEESHMETESTCSSTFLKSAGK